MKIRDLRNSALLLFALVLLLVLIPAQIVKIIHTGEIYLFSRHFFDDMVARLSGPGRIRFIIQPLVAMLLGLRDGRKDARMQYPPFLSALFHGGYRSSMMRVAIRSVVNLVAVAILLDVISQYLIFGEVHPGAALLLGPVLIGLPYGISRALTNRIVKLRTGVTRIS